MSLYDQLEIAKKEQAKQDWTYQRDPNSLGQRILADYLKRQQERRK